MQKSSDKITFLVGCKDYIEALRSVEAKEPFAEEIIDFLNDVSRSLMSDKRSKEFSDVVTFAFWIRKSSVNKLKERFYKKDENPRFGRGVAFHIAPSNVPVNFAYSLAVGLLTGNANVVRVPSKDFEQVSIILDALNETLRLHKEFQNYINLIRYDRNKEVNDMLSSLSDVRIIWGGDATIEDIRRSPIPARAVEVTFADRYSLAVIDSDAYMDIENKEIVAEAFYNDTFLTDQNACTSPRVVIWTGNSTKEAKELFWEKEHRIVEKKYTLQPVQAVSKLTSICLVGAIFSGCKVCKHKDNLIIRVDVSDVSSSLMDYKDNSGFFFEYECKDISGLKEICNDKRCQTIGYIGDKEMFEPLIRSGIKGVDRIVPLGRTMDFDLIWDGYNLVEAMTRVVSLR